MWPCFSTVTQSTSIISHISFLSIFENNLPLILSNTKYKLFNSCHVYMEVIWISELQDRGEICSRLKCMDLMPTHLDMVSAMLRVLEILIPTVNWNFGWIALGLPEMHLVLIYWTTLWKGNGKKLLKSFLQQYFSIGHLGFFFL